MVASAWFRSIQWAVVLVSDGQPISDIQIQTGIFVMLEQYNAPPTSHAQAADAILIPNTPVSIQSTHEFQNYEKLIHQIEDDIAELSIGKEQLMANCDLPNCKRMQVYRNNTEGLVRIVMDIPCSMEDTRKHPTQQPKKPQSSLSTKSSHPQDYLKQELSPKTLQLLRQKQEQVSHYKQQLQIARQEHSRDDEEIVKLTGKVLELEAELSHPPGINTELYEVDYSKYERQIKQLQEGLNSLEDIEDLSTANTLRIVREDGTDDLQLEQLGSTRTGNSRLLKFYTCREIRKAESTSVASPDSLNKIMELQSQLKGLKANYNHLQQQSSNENSFLRTQIFSLLQQMQSMKVEYERVNNLLIEYEIKLSNNRDFYKVKLVDLERMVKEKTRYVQDLDNEIQHIEDELRDKMGKHEALDSLISSYSTTIKHLSVQLEQEQAKSLQLRKLLQQRNHLHTVDVQRFNKLAEDLSKEIQNESKYANEAYMQLKEQKKINTDLKGVVQKLWIQIKELNEQYKQKERECNQLKMSNQFEEEMEDMRRIIDDMSEELSTLKEDLFAKSEESEALKYSMRVKQQQIREYEAQIKLQFHTLEKLRQSSQKADDYILQLKSQLSETHSKLQQHEAKEVSKIKIDLENLKNKDMIQELKNMKLEDKNVSLQLVLKLIEIIEQYSFDIDNLEDQSNQLRNMIIEYEQIIEQQVAQIRILKTEEMEESQHRFSRKIVSNLRSNAKLQRYRKYHQPQFEQQQDLALYEEIVEELEREKQQNMKLSFKLKEAHKELMMYEKEIFEKTQAINYLNLALIKASTSVQEIEDPNSVGGLKLQNEHLQRDVDQVRSQKGKLQQTVKRIVSSKNKEIQMLKYQLGILDNNVIPELKEQNNYYVRTIDKLEADNRRLLKEVEKMTKSSKVQDCAKILHETKSQKNNMTLEQLKSKKCSYLTTLYIMLRLCETLDESGHLKSFHPQDIYLLGFNELRPQTLKIKLAQCGGEHENGVFTAPEVIRGQRESRESISWNYGLILDYLLHRESYYLSESEVLSSKKQYKVRGKIPTVLQGLLQGLLTKDKRKRVRLGECVQVLRQEIENSDCSY